MKLHICLTMLVALLLAACGPIQAGSQATPIPTPSVTANTRATGDAEFNARVIGTGTALHLTALAASSGTAPESTRPPDGTATVTAATTPVPLRTEQSVANTPTRSPTPMPFPTEWLTPRPPTLTPPSGKPAVLSFTVDRTVAKPGENVTLSWTTVGGETATLSEGICCLNNGGDETRSVPPNGSLVVNLEGVVERDRLDFWLEVRNASGATSARQRVDLPCPDSYFFSSPDASAACPASPPVYSPAAEQLFENGRMLWVQSTGTIYVVFGDGSPNPSGQPPDGFVQYPDTWKEGEPESDPSLVPPAGRYQPVRGFGKVWRNGERDNLGWALGPEQAFDGVIQSPWSTCRHRDLNTRAVVNCSGVDGNHTYLRTADGRLILLTGFLNHTPQHWAWFSAP
jgi:hypothetical protein